MWNTFWKTIIYSVLLLLTCCTGCALLPDKPTNGSCDKESVQNLVIAAKKAGCSTYKIEMDQFLKSCTFTCYGSR
jgi:hypothetical protein